MKYTLTKEPNPGLGTCLVLGVFPALALTGFAKQFDEQHQGLISRLCTKLDEPGDMVSQAEVDGFSVLLVHCGKQAEFDWKQLKKNLNAVTTTLLKQGVNKAILCLPRLLAHAANWQLEQMVLQMDALSYQLLDFKSKQKKPHALASVELLMPDAQDQAIHAAQAIAAGVRLTKTLTNLPANHCTPTFLGETALALTKDNDKLAVKVLDKAAIQELGMGALLAVAKGSAEPPRFIEISYRGAHKEKPIVLVGKGITFDSGGLSLKLPELMMDMKFDMAGAATVLGTLKACALLKLPINVVGLIACAENLPSGTAVKPGDIVTTLSGQTVEILNTDAEGRLVLADALTYAERFHPSFVVDIATLTGAMIVALGFHTTGFMTADEDLADTIRNAALESDDACWRLPLHDCYQEALDSNWADMINSNFDRSAGSITAACFLSRYTKKFRWAHLDIAGTAWSTGKNRQATGRPVPLLVQMLRHVANSR